MSNAKTKNRIAEAMDWTSIVVVAAAIAAYFITLDRFAPLFFLIPAIAMRVVALRLKYSTDNIWLLVGTIAATLLTVIAAFGQ